MCTRVHQHISVDTFFMCSHLRDQVVAQRNASSELQLADCFIKACIEHKTTSTHLNLVLLYLNLVLLSTMRLKR
jgi:hypothetical protein